MSSLAISTTLNGQSGELAIKAARCEQKTSLLQLEDDQIINIQVKLFTDYISAKVSGNDKLAQFYSDRFPPELRVDFDR